MKNKGLNSDDINRLFRKTTTVVLTNPSITHEEFVIQLSRMGWKRPILDSETSASVLQVFLESGFFTDTKSAFPDDPDGLNQILKKIFLERGLDFRGYARSSISRRIENRLKANNIASYGKYEGILDSNQEEYDRLLDELTVTFTQFMRDKEAFSALRGVVKEHYQKPDQNQLTVWSAGCATGQEPYSIAMLVAEATRDNNDNQASIIATDIDQKAIQFAGRGRYEIAAKKEIPEKWNDYFIINENRLELVPEIQNMVQFQQHNLTSDAPLAQVDIICCRNVLIYFNIQTQLRVINQFYRSLQDSEGYLLLGRYEMLTKEARNLFSCVDFDARLYKRK